jgi:hypothetical protein
MYDLVLTAHSWLRWAALIAGVVATAMVVIGQPAAAARTPTTPPRDGTDRWGLFFMIALDLQLLLGLLLYFALSPNTRAIFDDFGAAMRDPAARFWAVEHISLMLAAVVLAHLGRVLARKAPNRPARRTRLLVCFGLATIAMIAATPWPGMANGRPLFRL